MDIYSHEPLAPPGESCDVDIPLAPVIEKMLANTAVINKEINQPKEPIVDLDEIKKHLLKQQEEPKIEENENNIQKTRKEKAVEESERYRRAKRNKKKRERKKRRKGERSANEDTEESDSTEVEAADVEIEYVQDEPDFSDPRLYMFKKVFQAFQIADEINSREIQPISILKSKEKVIEKTRDFGEDSSDDEKKGDKNGKEKLSKKKLRRLNRLSVAELKQLVTRPDVVEMHDVTAQDPRLLVHLKATRNTVTVPRHWCFKRKYLQGKRGFEKPPFQLPECIRNTGITEMRQALQDKEDSRTMKTKMREKIRPKLGKIDIDYQKLHDAFFRYQTKPRMTIHGDLYYEGKEFETRLKEKKPGELSDSLRNALGMPTIGSGQKVPPPWLIAMQRYGPPPSYPNLKIPGLNCPIPDGCSFGYHAGGWGKPPVDEYSRPLYGDVFGVAGMEGDDHHIDEDVDQSYWGELESESEDSSAEEEEEEEEEMMLPPEDSGIVTPAERYKSRSCSLMRDAGFSNSGMATPSGISSVPSGMETPDMIELRKKKIEDAMEGGDTPQQLYQVLPEKQVAAGSKPMMGSSHVYDIVNQVRRPPGSGGETEGIEIALNPDELDDTQAMAAKYERRVKEQEQVVKEDFSDLVAEHAAKQKKKRKAQTQEGSKPTKKYKEFKF